MVLDYSKWDDLDDSDDDATVVAKADEPPPGADAEINVGRLIGRNPKNCDATQSSRVDASRASLLPSHVRAAPPHRPPTLRRSAAGRHRPSSLSSTPPWASSTWSNVATRGAAP